MTTYQPLGIRPEAAPAWRNLRAALDQQAESGRPVACVGRPELFFSDDPEQIAEAIEMCGWCPVRQLCEAFADANRERYGVWAGRDRSPRTGSRKANAA